MKDYPAEGEKIVYLSDDDFTYNLVMIYGYNRLRARLIGGYCFPDFKAIYIRESRRGDIKLLNHERGHLRGYSHTCYPTLMNPSWAGMIFNSYFPYKEVKHD